MSETKRVIIIGNSGSGKTWLGKALSRKMNISLYHMDNIRWDQRGYEMPRPTTDIEKDLQGLIKQDSWILEGVFGKMAQYYLPFSNLLIWLDVSWKQCKQNLLSRGPQFEDLPRPNEKEKALAKLIAWASEHCSRNDANS